MNGYDPDLIGRHAERWRARAVVTIALNIGLGVLIGFVGGPLIMQSLPADLAEKCPPWFPPLLLGLLGLGQGMERATMMKLQAQILLCQVQIERNTREMREGAIAPVVRGDTRDVT